MLKRFVVALMTVVAGSVGANAADMAVKARPAAVAAVPYFSWTGFYAGLAVGYHDGSITQAGCTGLCPVDPKMSGAVLAVSGGADYQFANNIVIGAFATIPITRLKGNVDLAPAAPGIVFTVRPQFVALAGVRLGYAVGNFLPFVLGGVGYADIEAKSPFGATPSNSHVGATVGAGLEYRIAQHWSVDFRYAYMSLPKKTYDFGGGLEQFGEDSHNYKFGAYYRF